MKPALVDPVALTADLIRCPSVTPVEGGALQLLQQLLSSAGFDCGVWTGMAFQTCLQDGADAVRIAHLVSTAIPMLCLSEISLHGLTIPLVAKSSMAGCGGAARRT